MIWPSPSTSTRATDLPQTYIEDIAKHEGERVTIHGWLANRRSSGKIHFLQVRDGSGFIQAVMSKAAVGDELFQRADHLSQESAIVVTGTARADARAPGGYEIDVTGLEVVSEAHDFPITPKEHGVDFLMDRRHLWIRSARQQAVLRVRHEVIDAVRDYFNSRGFVLADTPIFTPSACEGTTTLFPVQYFEDTTAYLTQSGQLYNEANAMALGRVYCFGPTFRAEKSKTRRHLTEFWMVEPEVAYATLDDIIVLAEGLVVEVVARVLDRRARELQALERDTTTLQRVKAPFPRLTYDEAAALLKQKGLPFEWGGDFGSPDETAISEHSMVRSPSTAIRARSKRSTSNRSRIAQRCRCRSTSWRPKATARSSAAASGSTTTTCCSRASKSTSCRARRSSGTWICAATAACRTPASAWASSASSPGSAGSSTSGKRFRIRGCCTGCTPDGRYGLTASGFRGSGFSSMKIGLVSLGCPKNLVDGEVMLGLAREAGHEITADAADADVIVVNTCAFIDDAKEESIDAILEMARLKRDGGCRKLIVTGCLAERYRDELKREIPEIDVCLGTGEVPDIVGAIAGTRRSHPPLPRARRSRPRNPGTAEPQNPPSRHISTTPRRRAC